MIFFGLLMLATSMSYSQNIMDASLVTATRGGRYSGVNLWMNYYVGSKWSVGLGLNHFSNELEGSFVNTNYVQVDGKHTRIDARVRRKIDVVESKFFVSPYMAIGYNTYSSELNKSYYNSVTPSFGLQMEYFFLRGVGASLGLQYLDYPHANKQGEIEVGAFGPNLTADDFEKISSEDSHFELTAGVTIVLFRKKDL